MKKYGITTLTIGLIIALTAVCILSGILAIETDAAQDHPLKIWAQNKNGRFMTLVVVDEKTGVNYVVVSNSYEWEPAICPRYNADGSLYVTP